MYGSDDDMEMMKVNSSDVTVLVSGLNPFTNYTFYVLAVTVAPSGASNNVTVLTNETGRWNSCLKYTLSVFLFVSYLYSMVGLYSRNCRGLWFYSIV